MNIVDPLTHWGLAINIMDPLTHWGLAMNIMDPLTHWGLAMNIMDPLTHWGLPMNIRISELCHFWFSWWLGMQHVAVQGLYAPSGRMSYCKISWSLAAARFGSGFSNRSEICQTPLQQGCRGACQISEWYNHDKIQSRGFETSWDLAVRCLTA